MSYSLQQSLSLHSEEAWEQVQGQEQRGLQEQEQAV
jgi:hypothetical protein